MKIGLIGINSSTEEKDLLRILEILNKSFSGIFSTQSDEILPISEKFKLKLFSSSSDLFSSVDAVYFARSLKPNFEYAIRAIKNSCHLFIEDISTLEIDEIKQLYKVASEARTKIHIKQSKLFTSEYLELSDYIENPQLIELNSDCISLLRKQDHFKEIFNNLCFADSVTKSSIKKISTTALPLDKSHFSLVQVRINYDNGAIFNLKLNNLSQIKKDQLMIYQQNNVIDIDFTEHFATKHSFENGQVVRTEFNINEISEAKNEMKYFIEFCNDIDGEISETPSILKTIQNTFLAMHHLEQASIKS